MSQLARMKSDLTCGFGFKKINADIALARYASGDLLPAEIMTLDYLKHESPFELGTPQTLQRGAAEILNRLNYRISQELESD